MRNRPATIASPLSVLSSSSSFICEAFSTTTKRLRNRAGAVAAATLLGIGALAVPALAQDAEEDATEETETDDSSADGEHDAARDARREARAELGRDMQIGAASGAHRERQARLREHGGQGLGVHGAGGVDGFAAKDIAAFQYHRRHQY